MTPVLLKPSIRLRIAVVLVAACALVWMAVYAQGIYITRKPETGSYDRDMLMVAKSVVSTIDQWPDRENMRIAMSGLDAFIDQNNQLFDVPSEYLVFHVWDTQGRLVMARKNATTLRKSSFGTTGFSDQTLEGVPLRVYGEWTKDHQFLVEATQTSGSRQSFFHGVMLSRESLNIFFVGLLCLIPILLVVQSGFRPLTDLAKELANRKPGDLSPIRSSSQYLEIAPLVDEFNLTLERLESLLERERSFLADAAHELRTPIAVITAQIDTLILAREVDTRAEAAKRLKQGLGRATRLVNQLLVLARLDAKTELFSHEIDVADVIRDCLAAHASVARQGSMDLEYAGPASIPTVLPLQAVESILDNLIGNAVRYGHEKGCVEVRASHDSGFVTIEVADDGPGIDSLDQSKIYERFHRGNQPDVHGSGLGLAIVAAASKQLGAVLSTGQGLLGRGVTFRVVFPLNC